MKKLIFSTLISSVLLITGCSVGVEINNTNNVTSVERECLEVKAKEKSLIEIEKNDFDLGKNFYKSQSGKVLPYNVSGAMSLPKKDGKSPLALIIHGSHDNDNLNTPLYKGFQYLIDFLASRGYAAASLNVQPAYVWSYGDNDDNEKIRAMYRVYIDDLKKSKFKDKIDFENIVLIGHSRGGQTVLDIAKENENIKGIISIAPTEPTDLNSKFKDIPSAIIIPEFDGDVISLDGFPVYEAIVSDSSRLSNASLVLLKKANHNWFNSELKINDTKLLSNEDKLKTQLKKEEQQVFIKNFAADFVDYILNKDNNISLFDGHKAEPSKMYGVDVKTKIFKSGKKNIIDYNEVKNIQANGVELNSLRADIFYKKDESEGFRIPLSGQDGFDHKNLIKLEWKNRGASIDIFLEDLDNIEFKNKSSLSLDIAVNAASKLNEKNKEQMFTIRVVDKKGNIADVVINNKNNSLEYVKGFLDFTEIEGKKYYFWSEYIPLSTIKVPIESFKEININEIESLSLIFDKTDSGSIMLENISVN